MHTRIIGFSLTVLLFPVFSYLLLHQYGFEVMDSRFVVLGYVVLIVLFLLFIFKKRYRKITLSSFILSLVIYTILITILHTNHPIIYCWNLSIVAEEKPYSWPEANPAEIGIDTIKFNKVLNQMGEIHAIRSFLVVKDGKLIAEKYYKGAKPTDAMNIKSATKSITSTLVGIAIQEGFIDSVGQRVIDFFPEHRSQIKDPQKLSITIRDILTMRSGYPAYIPFKKDFTVENILLNVSVVEEPGHKFSYHAPASQIIAGIIERASNMSFDEFVRQYLYQPLGISCAYWQKLPDGLNQSDCEAYFTPRDLARIGYLYENGGVLNGNRIIDSVFLKEATIDQIHSRDELWQFDDCIKNDGYGFWWWTVNSNGYNEFAARGAGGQLIHVIPELDLVIVMLRKHFSTKHLSPEEDKSFLICDLISSFRK